MRRIGPDKYMTSAGGPPPAPPKIFDPALEARSPGHGEWHSHVKCEGAMMRPKRLRGVIDGQTVYQRKRIPPTRKVRLDFEMNIEELFNDREDLEAAAAEINAFESPIARAAMKRYFKTLYDPTTSAKERGVALDKILAYSKAKPVAPRELKVETTKSADDWTNTLAAFDSDETSNVVAFRN